LAAAEGLTGAVSAGDNILIATGGGGSPWLPKGENDGPIGAAALARALALGVEARPIYLCEEHQVEPIVASSHAAGLMVMDYETAQRRTQVAVVEVVPSDRVEAETKARRLLKKYQPQALIAIERLGPNEKGVVHSILGKAIEEAEADLSFLFNEARERGIFTLGIGDGGNEIGFGRITESVRQIQPYGRRCQCPCGAGMATVVATDVLVVAAVSNWGAYGVEAMLAFLLQKPELLHTPELERWMLEECIRAGGSDGAYAIPAYIVDGISGDVHQGLVRMLGEIVANGLTSLDRAF